MDGRPTWKKKKGGRRSEGGRDGRQEKGKKEKQPTSKSNQTVLFILPLSHPNCPPLFPPLSCSTSTWAVSQERKRRKEKEAPLPPLFRLSPPRHCSEQEEGEEGT